jgi:hypothetical protein
VVLFVPLVVSELILLWGSSSLGNTSPGDTLSHKLYRCLVLMFDGIALSVVIIAVSGALDYAMYGRFVFPAWVNLEFNVLQNASANYGSHPFHWYFTQGMPAMLASLLPLVLGGVLSVVCRTQAAIGVPLWPLLLGIWGIAIHSVLAHKEFRYILPSFELVLLYAAVPVAAAMHAPSAARRGQTASTGGTDSAHVMSAAVQQSNPDRDAQLRHRLRDRHMFQPVAVARTTADSDSQCKKGAKRQGWTWQCAACWVCCALQLPTVAYFGLVHQRGTVAVMEHLSHAQLPAVRAMLPYHHRVLQRAQTFVAALAFKGML